MLDAVTVAVNAAVIRRIAGTDDDLYQDIWLAVLESPDADIEELAKRLRKKATNQRIQAQHGLLSIDKPMGDEGDDFTLKDVIAAPEVSEAKAIEPGVPRFHHNYNSAATTIHLDRESMDELHRRYPNVPLKHAVRSMLGLPDARGLLGPWQSAEDDLIRERYPWGGAKGCVVDLSHRTLTAIRSRAQHLGVRLEKFRPKADWYTSAELAAILGLSQIRVLRITQAGYIKAQELPFAKDWKRKFYTQADVETFLRNHPECYIHTAIQERYQPFIPLWYKRMIPFKDACRLHHYLYSTGLLLRREFKTPYFRACAIGFVDAAAFAEAVKEQMTNHRSLSCWIVRRHSHRRGPKEILSPREQELVFEMRRKGKTLREVALAFKVSGATVSRICSRHPWLKSKPSRKVPA